MERALAATLKRDDDARVTILMNESETQIRGIVVETSETQLVAPFEPWLSRLERWLGKCSDACLDRDLLYNETIGPVPDVHTRVVRHVHMTNLVFVGLSLVLGLPFYYWPIQRLALILLVSFGSATFTGLYLGLIAFRHSIAYGWWEGCCLMLTAAAAIMMGSAAALSQSIAPFELLATFWIQSIMVLMYTQWSPRNATHLPTMAALMAGATLCVWALGILAAFEMHGWRSAIVVLVLSTTALLYQMAWLRISLVTDYNVSWRDSVLATTEFYGAPVILLHAAAATGNN